MAKKIKLLRISQAAEILAVNPETLRRWDRSGELRTIKLGRRGDRRYKKEDVVRFIKKLAK